MESAKKKCKLTVRARQLWELNICVTCAKPLDSTSKLLSCLHGVCNQCIYLCFKKTGNFVCDCGVATDISKRLINCTLYCEQFDEYILRNDYMDEEYQKKEYGQYITKVPCPNCKDKYIEAYCTTCNKLHCGLCQLVNHRTHRYKTLSKAIEEIRSNLMKNKVDLCEKSNFAFQVKSCLMSNITTLRTQKNEMKMEIQKKFDEFRDELIISEDRMMDYVESYYNVKLEHLTKNKMLMEELKKKYDFYLYFSQSALKRENQADLDMTNLVNNQLSSVRKGFMVDISGLDSTNTKSFELTVVLDDTLHKLIESVKSIAISKPQTYVNAIDAISKTVDIKSFPGYHSVTKYLVEMEVEMEVFVVAENKKIIFNGYAYTVQHNQVSSIRWKCSNKMSKKCPGILVTSNDYKNPTIEVEHSHAGDENLETVEKAKVEMLKRVSTFSTSTPSQIFAEVINQVPEQALTSTSKKIEDIPITIIDDNQVDKVKYHLPIQQRKGLKSSAGVSSHLDTNKDNM